MKRYSQGATPPGLHSPNFKPLKTWHIATQYGAVCGAVILGQLFGEVPTGARLCGKCAKIAEEPE